MNLSYDEGSVNKKKKCPECGSSYVDMRRFILLDNVAYAVAFIEAHRHQNEAELYITCIFGSWGEADAENSDHVTFCCRYGNTENYDGMACTAIDVLETFDSSFAGKKLRREEALSHSRINEFWEVVDFIVLEDIEIHNFFEHPNQKRIWFFSKKT